MGLAICILARQHPPTHPSTLELGNLGSLGSLIKMSQVAYSLDAYGTKTRRVFLNFNSEQK